MRWFLEDIFLKISSHIGNIFFRKPGNKLHIIAVIGEESHLTAEYVHYGLSKVKNCTSALISKNALIFPEKNKIDVSYEDLLSGYSIHQFMALCVQKSITHLVIQIPEKHISFFSEAEIPFDTMILTDAPGVYTEKGYRDEYISFLEKLVVFYRKPGIKKSLVIHADISGLSDFTEITADSLRTYSYKKTADLQWDINKMFPDKTNLTIHLPSHTFSLEMGNIGSFYISDILGAVSVYHVLGFSIDVIKKICVSFPDSIGYMKKIPNHLGIYMYRFEPNSYYHMVDIVRNIRENFSEKNIRILYDESLGFDEDKIVFFLNSLENKTYLSINTIEKDLQRDLRKKITSDFWVIPNRKDLISTAFVEALPETILLIFSQKNIDSSIYEYFEKIQHYQVA